MTCLCLGPSGSGKSLLIKQLQNQNVTRTTIPIETVGTNIVRIHPSPDEVKDKHLSHYGKIGLEIREVGGSMAPLWPSYYGPSIKTILFVMDSSNLFQVSISTVLLLEILSHPKLPQVKVLIILNKMDLTTRKKINYLKFMMRLQNIVQESGKKVTLEEISALTGEGVEDVRHWIFTNSLTKIRVSRR